MTSRQYSSPTCSTYSGRDRYRHIVNLFLTKWNHLVFISKSQKATIESVLCFVCRAGSRLFSELLEIFSLLPVLTSGLNQTVWYINRLYYLTKSLPVSNEENIKSCVGGDIFFFEVIQALTKKCVYEGFAKQA